MTQTVSIIPYERKYREDILSLMFFSRHTHTHLDWYKAGQWLDLQGNIIALAFFDDVLIGVMGLAEPLNRTTWLRLLIIAQGYSPSMMLPIVWEHMQDTLKARNVCSVSILAINPWIVTFLPDIGFEHDEDVITMHRAPLALQAEPETTVSLRNGYLEDIQQIVEIDHAAFGSPWQMSATDIRLAQRQAASCTLAVAGDHVVGYQIATRHHTSGHLARLAVHPDSQGQRVGQLLLHDLIARFEKRGVRGVTVNTQESNLRSQALYHRFGFIRNGFDIPVWHIQF